MFEPQAWLMSSDGCPPRVDQDWHMARSFVTVAQLRTVADPVAARGPAVRAADLRGWPARGNAGVGLV
ncbi:MAG: hypothetical protein DLM60_13155 [Pseudonocardiales bacterium]|nr:MAG: hypothetical protein DLM60_13155 [Pseudonocardiales bacterium]